MSPLDSWTKKSLCCCRRKSRPNHSPQLTDKGPVSFSLKSKVVLILAVVDAGEIERVGWFAIRPMIGVVGDPPSTVLVNEVDGSCCSCSSDTEVISPSTRPAIGLPPLSPVPPFLVFVLPLLVPTAFPPNPTGIPEPLLRTRRALMTGLGSGVTTLEVSEPCPCAEAEVSREAILDERDPVAFGFVTRSAKEVLDGTTVSGPPTCAFACICECECGVEEWSARDADVDAEREFDEES